MNAQQKSALEGLIDGAALTAPQIAAIDLVLPARNDMEIARVLSSGRTKVKSRLVGIGFVMAELSPNGGTFLNALETVGATDANAKWTLKLIERGELDIGAPAIRSFLVTLAQTYAQLQAGLVAIRNAANQPDPISVNAVSNALNIAEGKVTL